MMSVNELFYGYQDTSTQMARDSYSQVKPQQAPYGTRSPFLYDATFWRDDRDAVLQAQNRSYANPSSLNTYTSKYQLDPQLQVDSRYTSSAYISSSAREYADSPAPITPNHRRSNFSADFSSPSYSLRSSRGGNSKPVSTWVELRVPICCEACVERLNKHLLDVRGVESVTCDQRKQRVVVRGTAAAGDILKLCKKLFKGSEYWRYQFDW